MKCVALHGFCRAGLQFSRGRLYKVVVDGARASCGWSASTSHRGSASAPRGAEDGRGG